MKWKTGSLIWPYAEWEQEALPIPENAPRGVLIHNPAFGLLLKGKLDNVGIENHFYHGGNKPPKGAEEQFILKHFFEGEVK